jgi:hypothetical protein
MNVAAPERLAEAVAARGFDADVRALPGWPPYLDVRNPRAVILAERVYAHDDVYWWSWQEKIAGCDEVTTAAGIVARVLRTAGE